MTPWCQCVFEFCLSHMWDSMRTRDLGSQVTADHLCLTTAMLCAYVCVQVSFALPNLISPEKPGATTRGLGVTALTCQLFFSFVFLILIRPIYRTMCESKFWHSL